MTYKRRRLRFAESAQQQSSNPGQEGKLRSADRAQVKKEAGVRPFGFSSFRPRPELAQVLSGRSILVLFGCLTIFLAFSGLACARNSGVLAEFKRNDQEKKVEIVNQENESQVVTAPQGDERDLKFECSVSKAESEIVVKYALTNNGAKDIYVIDAYPMVDPNSRTASAELKSFFLSYREPSTAVVLKGIPPLPSMPVAVRIMPLGTKLGPKATINREFIIPLPLRERSDWYYAPLPPEEYLDKTADKIIFNLQIMRTTVEGFKVKPAHYAPDYFIVSGSNTVKQVETLTRSFAIEKVQLFVRKDLFSRL
jgi:hypothetical protein